MQYYNDTNIITIDQIIDAMTTHKPVVNPTVLDKDITAYENPTKSKEIG